MIFVIGKTNQTVIGSSVWAPMNAKRTDVGLKTKAVGFFSDAAVKSAFPTTAVGEPPLEVDRIDTLSGRVDRILRLNVIG
jgi:hypothetical protein